MLPPLRSLCFKIVVLINIWTNILIAYGIEISPRSYIEILSDQIKYKISLMRK